MSEWGLPGPGLQLGHILLGALGCWPCGLSCGFSWEWASCLPIGHVAFVPAASVLGLEVLREGPAGARQEGVFLGCGGQGGMEDTLT